MEVCRGAATAIRMKKRRKKQKCSHFMNGMEIAFLEIALLFEQIRWLALGREWVMRCLRSHDKNSRVNCTAALQCGWPGALCAALLMGSFAVAGDKVAATDSTDVASPTWELQLERVTEITHPFLEKPVSQTEEVTLLLDRRGYALVEPKQTIRYDATKRRLFTLNHNENHFSEMPLHALVWFRANETMHRNAMCHVLEDAQQSLLEMEPCSRFELETLLSISVPNQGDCAMLRNLGDLVKHRCEPVPMNCLAMHLALDSSHGTFC